MKVLHIAAGFPSIEKPYFQPFIKSQIESLRKEGIDIDIYEIKGANSIFKYLKAVIEIKKLSNEKNYDIIHAHYSYCGLSAYLAKTGKILILSLMGSDLIGVHNAKGKITIRGKFDKFLTHYISKKVKYLIVKSQFMKNLLIINTPTSVIPNGVNFELFRPINTNLVRAKLGFAESDFLILFLGNPIDKGKNFNLVKNAVEVFKKTENHKIKLINPYGIDQKTVVEYMNAANVLILSSFYEGSPNVIKEAMACNLPIISTDVGDVKVVIHGAENCFIVGYSANEIADKLMIIYQNKKRSNGRERINHLRDDLTAKKINEIYKSLLKIQDS